MLSLYLPLSGRGRRPPDDGAGPNSGLLGAGDDWIHCCGEPCWVLGDKGADGLV